MKNFIVLSTLMIGFAANAATVSCTSPKTGEILYQAESVQVDVSESGNKVDIALPDGQYVATITNAVCVVKY